MEKSAFKEILSLTDGPDQYELNPHGFIKLKSRPFPWSIMHVEFDLIRSIIVSNDLKRGLDIGTGIGISSIAAGLGFKETGGKLVTVDSYIEDQHNSHLSYRRAQASVYPDSIGLKCTNHLVNHFDLADTVFTEVGWTPRDTASIFRKHFQPNEKLDYVFVDGGGFPEQIVKDIESFAPFLSSRYIVLFHDMFERTFEPAVVARIRSVLKKEPMLLMSFATGFSNHLGMVSHL